MLDALIGRFFVIVPARSKVTAVLSREVFLGSDKLILFDLWRSKPLGVEVNLTLTDTMDVCDLLESVCVSVNGLQVARVWLISDRQAFFKFCSVIFSSLSK